MIEDIDVQNLNFNMKQKILANMVFDRHGHQISRIIHKKSEQEEWNLDEMRRPRFLLEVPNADVVDIFVNRDEERKAR